MTDEHDDPVQLTSAMRSDLERLIEALDRRVPRLERVGEAKIAREAAELRKKAVKLIRQLDSSSPDR